MLTVLSCPFFLMFMICSLIYCIFCLCVSHFSLWFLSIYMMCVCFFFFKQKTAYEMRISDWSSDVCSSDLVVKLTLETPSHEATHWTVRAMAKAVGIAASSVVKIWHDHGLAPHRWRSFKLSNDKAFAEKLHDVVGLYVSPPAHAIVLSVDEKSQIQALDRTQPGLPLKRGRGATMTHDYKRNGTTTLFAALNVLDGSVIGRNMQRHRHQEFIRFLNTIEAQMPADKAIHVILDNYATHKQPKVRAWLARHPRWTFHFITTSCSWLHAVEGFFATLTRRRQKKHRKND